MVDMNVPDAQARGRILATLFKGLQQGHNFDGGVMEAAIAATSELTLAQLQSASMWLLKHPPKGPIIAAILESVDRSTRYQQDKAHAERGYMVVPYINGASEEQVQPWSKPAGHQWTDVDVAKIHDALRIPWSEALVRRFAQEPVVLDPEVFGPPPDENNKETPTPERRKQLMAQTQEILARASRKSYTAMRKKGIEESARDALKGQG